MNRVRQHNSDEKDAYNRVNHKKEEIIIKFFEHHLSSFANAVENEKDEGGDVPRGHYDCEDKHVTVKLGVLVTVVLVVMGCY